MFDEHEFQVDDIMREQHRTLLQDCDRRPLPTTKRTRSGTKAYTQRQPLPTGTTDRLSLRAHPRVAKTRRIALRYHIEISIGRRPAHRAGVVEWRGRDESVLCPCDSSRTDGEEHGQRPRSVCRERSEGDPNPGRMNSGDVTAADREREIRDRRDSFHHYGAGSRCKISRSGEDGGKISTQSVKILGQMH